MPLVNTNLLVRYHLDDAASGTAPTAVADASGNGYDLDTVDYGSGNMAWVEDASGFRGLECTTILGAGIAKRTIATSGDLIRTAIDGAQQMTFEVVFRDDAYTATGDRRIFGICNGTTGQHLAHLMASTSATWSYTLGWEGSGGLMQWNALDAGVRRVCHVVIDTTQATAADRCRIWWDGVEVTSGNKSITIAQNDTLTMGTDAVLALLNWVPQTRSLNGAVYYAALYSGAMAPADVATNAAVLAARADKPTALGGTPLVRYHVDEAASGSAPTSLADASGNAYDLTLNYGSGNMAWTEPAAGQRGLDIGAVTGAQGAERAVGPSGEALFDAVDGQKKFTIEVVVTMDGTYSLLHRLFGVEDQSGFGNSPILCLGSTGKLSLRGFGGAGDGLVTTPALTSRSVIHCVVDSTQATQLDRVKYYVDGVEITSGKTVPFAQDAAATLASSSYLSFGNSHITARSPLGVIHYAAMYVAAFSPAEVYANAAVLAARADKPTTLGNTDLLVRYYLNEAASGTGPTSLLDASGNAYHLDTVDYGAGNMAFVESTGGQRGLECTTLLGDGYASHSIDDTSDLIRDALVGAQKLTFELVLRDDEQTSGSGIRWFGITPVAGGATAHVMGIATSNAYDYQIGWKGADNIVRWNAISVGVRRVLHVAIDTTQATQADRARIWWDGVEVTDKSVALTLNDALTMSANARLIAMNWLSALARSPNGVLHYAALYAGAMSPAEVYANAALLDTSDDTPAGGSPTAMFPVRRRR